MPIKFRCPVCEGLLSIARRKAGTQVVCPKCGDEVTVPDADLAAGDFDADEEPSPRSSAEKNGSGKKPGEPPLFDRESLEKLLKPDDSGVRLAAPPATSPVPQPVEAAEDGVLISRGTLVVLGILVVVLISLAFATGWLIGS